MSFDEELRTALRDLVPAHEPAPGLAERVEGLARGRRRRLAVAGAAMAAAAACVLGVLVAAPFTRTAQPLPTGLSAGPPPVSTAGPHLILSSTVLPPSGGELGMLVANPGETGLMYGLDGRIDRWEGGHWQHYAAFVSSDPESTRSGAVVDPGSPVSATSLGLLAVQHSYGAALWVKTGPLAAGYYRFVAPLVSSDVEASGVLEVRPGAKAVAEVLPRGRISVGIAQVVPAGRATWVVVGQAGDRAPLVIGGVKRVVVRRLDPSGWSRVGDFPVLHSSSPSYAVHLPALPPGIYDLAQRARGEVLHGVFWVQPALT